MTIKDVLKTQEIFFAALPTRQHLLDLLSQEYCFEIKFLSSNSMLAIIGQSKKICDMVSLGAGSNRPPRIDCMQGLVLQQSLRSLHLCRVFLC